MPTAIECVIHSDQVISDAIDLRLEPVPVDARAIITTNNPTTTFDGRGISIFLARTTSDSARSWI